MNGIGPRLSSARRVYLFSIHLVTAIMSSSPCLGEEHVEPLYTSKANSLS